MVIYCIFFISILFHEIGHFLIGKLFKVRFQKYNIGILGCSVKYMRLYNIQNYKKLLIFIAGPLFNFGLAILFLFIENKWQYEIVYTNLILGIFNIIPIIPLDGGNIMICLFSYKFTYKKSLKFSLIISKILLIFMSFMYGIFIIVLKNIWILFLIIYLWKIYLEEEKKIEIYSKIKCKYEEILKL